VLNSKLKAATKKLELRKTQEHELSVSTRGQYLPFRKIWEEEGLDEAGFQALPWKSKSPRIPKGKKHVV
jgi:hypothetical protein